MALIGKNVIENLTTAMYEDLKIIYREYIQNSADAIDSAIREGILDKDEAHIDIDIKEKCICIYDNGTGIKAASFKKIMSSIADSTKDRTQEKGFRGIGRLGGLSSCDSLKFSCSAVGEAVMSTCIWNAKMLRDILIDKTQTLSASELVDKVTKYGQEECDEEEHFFRVELLGITDFAYELLDKQKVKNYLVSVAPIPYKTGFIFKDKILRYAKDHGFQIDTYKVYLNNEQLFKEYTTTLYETKNTEKRRYDELNDVEFEIFCNSKGEYLAWMWYGISNFEKQIPVVNPMRGIRLRKSNIQIGDENTFSTQHFYKEPRGYLYFVGEVFAVHPDLIPNARRDYFNINEACKEFESALKPLFGDRFYKIYHNANDYKKALQKKNELESSIQDYEDKKRKGGFLDQEDKESSEQELKEKEKKAEKAKKTIELRKKNDCDDEVLLRVYKGLDKKYMKSSEQSSERKAENTELFDEGKLKSNVNDKETKVKSKKQYLTGELSKYSKREQKLISRIYKTIKQILPNDTAELVINKLQEELKK